ncbi:hypothetical protein OESDEN_20307 [Oesophagostomum dentatum]|uniref:Uncharacterized protein n=1 Tax=Oesophagostomum dentatum TaxID=61180 RepID=A0A0B1S3T8_OESDE|nr:hypothetical protein OESDEN_20307 [Oesophagostomum dentatum]
MRGKFFSEIEKIRGDELPGEIRLSLEYDCELEQSARQVLETDYGKTTFDTEGVPLGEGIHLLFSSGGSKSTKKAVGSWEDELRKSLTNIGCKHRRLSLYLCHSSNSIRRVSKEWRKDLQSYVMSVGCNYLNSDGTHMHLCLYKIK